MKCNKCGTEYNFNEAMKMFNEEFNSDIDYEFDAPGLCGACAINFIKKELHRDEVI